MNGQSRITSYALLCLFPALLLTSCGGRSSALPAFAHLRVVAAATSRTQTPSPAACMTKSGPDRAQCLLAALTPIENGQPQPAWFRWHPNKLHGLNSFECPAQATAVAAASAKPASSTLLAGRLNIPKQLLAAHADIGTPGSNRFAETMFNDDAAASLCRQKKGSANVEAMLNHMLTKSPAGFTLGGTNPIAVKAIWGVVPYPALSGSDSYTSILSISDGTPQAAGPVDDWTTKLRVIDSARTAPCVVNRLPSPSPAAYSATLSCFYTMTVTQADLAASDNPVLRTGVDGQQGTVGYSFVLLGINVAAKFAGHWTWQTYWWDTRPFLTPTPTPAGYMLPSASAGIAAPFTHYVLNTQEDTGGFLYNPYLEARIVNGEQSRCAFCHNRATFVSRGRAKGSNAPDAHFLSTITGISQVFADPAYNPASTALPCSAAPGLCTDSLWSLADVDVDSINNPDAVVQQIKTSRQNHPKPPAHP